MMPHIFHVHDNRGRSWWVISDGLMLIRGTLAESKAEVTARWVDHFGSGSFAEMFGRWSVEEVAAQLDGMQVTGSTAAVVTFHGKEVGR